MNDEIVEELVRQIAALEKRLEYMETVEKSVFSTVTVTGGLTTTRTDRSIDTDGAITVTDCMFVGVDNFEDAATDNLDTLTGGVDGQIVILTARETAEVVTVRDDSATTGNICTSGAAARVLERASTGCDMLMLIFSELGSEWHEIGYGANAA